MKVYVYNYTNPEYRHIWFVAQINPETGADLGFLSKEGRWSDLRKERIWTVPSDTKSMQMTSFRHAVQVLKKVHPNARRIKLEHYRDRTVFEC